MPVLSDFTVVSEREFLSHRNFSANFNTGGRRDSQALLDIEFLGGYRTADSNMTIRIRLNGADLTSRTVRRWSDHLLIAFDRLNVVIPPGRLRDGNNTLEIRPAFESSSDYAFVGTVAVHFHQAT